ncbi:asparagine--tRNA ligase [bacterium]|nr:asparagine--tRNA ligase [bacterium]OIO87091.1 MAG: asparagine--tRNA ligase [Anaerolineae bacterium CG2_30_58_95]PIU90156.1 MAG: asparagine--tRNA ligase [Anaerolineae bacterium CG06_land_8_20_14_3_00_57_67]PIW19954.1 MAG: asparagine--tRNA ligase [Anaerolineae bacterium CG17_big_fil_post_rev_8_21_14_2_50_57_27]PJH75536.1 MAG: asparagine--tRNA ligase [Anaerolineae bacterium CG_4_9_14_0_8_um_filter_58_9]
MAIIRVDKITDYTGQEVTIQGWVYNRTDKGKLVFLLVRDGSGFVQCVAFKGDLEEALFDHLVRLPQESSVIITGAVRADKRAPGIPGGYEIGVKSVEIVQEAAEDYPMALKEHGVDFALDHRHLWIRMPSQWAILRVRATIISAMREWLDGNGFINMDTPILTPAACEGTTTLFETEYFDEGKAYLAQSGQLYNEANIMAFGKVYCFGPTFRAEKSKTRRHLTEFWMLEPEMAFCDLDQMMEVEEQMVTHIVKRVLRDRQPELKSLGRDTSTLEKIEPPFPRISYDDAVKMIDEMREKTDDPEQKELLKIEWGMDFGSPHETELTSHFEKPVFVYGYPTQVKAFYMEPWPGRPEVCKSVDLLAPEGYGEIIGGSERMADYNLLLQRIHEHGLPEEAFKWYLELRKYGSVPHSGFGMGVERTVAWLCGIEHIRETIPFPRTIKRVYP